MKRIVCCVIPAATFFVAAKAVRPGPSCARKTGATLANAFNLRVCPHAGDLMQVHQHMVKAIPNNWLLEVIPLWNEGPFVHQLMLEDGMCKTPTEPGASTDFTQKAFDEFRVS